MMTIPGAVRIEYSGGHLSNELLRNGIYKISNSIFKSNIHERLGPLHLSPSEFSKTSDFWTSTICFRVFQSDLSFHPSPIQHNSRCRAIGSPKEQATIVDRRCCLQSGSVGINAGTTSRLRLVRFDARIASTAAAQCTQTDVPGDVPGSSAGQTAECCLGQLRSSLTIEGFIADSSDEHGRTCQLEVPSSQCWNNDGEMYKPREFSSA